MVFNCLKHPWIFTSAVTVASIGASLLATFAALHLASYGDVPLAYALATFLPAIAVPVTVYPLVRANRRLRVMKSDLETLALTDVLTGLPNRRAFFERAEAIFARSADPIAAMMADIDRFKIINDTHGHNTGDTILRVVATTIRDVVASCGAKDSIVARIGGEEFAILVVGLDADRVVGLADRVRRAVDELRIVVDEVTLSTTVSVGVAPRRYSIEDVDTVLKAADDNMYAAKQSGRELSSFLNEEAEIDGLHVAVARMKRDPASEASAAA